MINLNPNLVEATLDDVIRIEGEYLNTLYKVDADIEASSEYDDDYAIKNSIG